MNGTQINKAMSEIFDIKWAELEGFPGYDVMGSTKQSVTLTRFRREGFESIAVHYVHIDEFLKDVKSKGKIDLSCSNVHITVEDGEVTGRRRHIATELVHEYGKEVKKPLKYVFGNASFALAKPTSLVLGNSEHPVARYGLAAKPVPKLDKHYYIICDGIAVVINTWEGWVNKFGSLDALKSAITAKADLSLGAVKIDPINKYLGNCVLDVLRK